MKKGTLVMILIACCSFAAKAQTYSFKNNSLDTIKSFSNPGIYLKQIPANPKFDSISVAADKANMLAALTRTAQPIPMPFVKPQDTDRMPVLKLGDTKDTHFTMMVKPLQPLMAQKPVNP